MLNEHNLSLNPHLKIQILEPQNVNSFQIGIIKNQYAILFTASAPMLHHNLENSIMVIYSNLRPS
jgi:hypothetical protein